MTDPAAPAAGLDVFPGGDLVAAGLAELARGRATSAEALLVCVAAPRLRQLGFVVPSAGPDDPERALYALLAAEHGDGAHGRYNALVRRAVSFARAYAALAGRRSAAGVA